MKKVGSIVSVLVLLIFLAGSGLGVSLAAEQQSQAAGKAKQDETAPGNAASVNGKAISMSDYLAEIDRLQRQIVMTGRNIDEKAMPALRQNALDNLIGKELVRQEIEKKGIKVDASEVDVQLNALKENTPPEDFANSLKQNNMTEQGLREHFGKQLAMVKLIEMEQGSKLTVTPQEVKAFYESNPDLFTTPEMVRASHILVAVDKNATAEQKTRALEKIKSVQKRIQGGEDFAKVAREVSDCPSKVNGGDLNFLEKGRTVPAFDKVVFSMKPGQTSDIVETEFGYHIIRVTERKAAAKVSFDEAKRRIEQHLKNEKINQQFPPFVEMLRSKADVKIFVKN